MLELFERGGIMMYPLALASLIAVALVIERLIALRKNKIIIPEVLAVVKNFSSLKDKALAISMCQKYDSPFSNMVQLSLEYHNLPKAELREMVEDQGRQEVRKLEKGLTVLETIAAISPLMGLLGTVIGMVRVFDVIKEQGIGQTAALSGGISEALLTTVSGLFVGIPVLIAYYYFSSKSEDLILDIEKYSNQLIQKINFLQSTPNQQQVKDEVNE